MRPPLVGVAVVSWNVRDLLLRCLESVRAAAPGDEARIVVVDNGSRDGSAEGVRSDHPDVTLIANQDNRGFTRGNNQALEALGVWDGTAPPYVLLLNPDAELRPGALATLVAHLEAYPGAACAGPLLRYGDGSIQSSRRRFPTLASGLFESTPLEWHLPGNRFARRLRMDDVPPDGPATVDWVTGAAMLLRTSALASVGPLDERFFMYSEELDLCRRLVGAGWTVRFEPAAEVVHYEGRSSGQVVAERHRHFARSRVRYFAKHHGAGAGRLVRAALLLGYLVELKLELAKWLVGHRRPLRRARIAAYAAILRDGLG